MCQQRFDVAPLRREFGPDADALWESVRAAMEPLAADGLLLPHERGFDVTPLGRLFLRNLAMPFDACLARHAEKPAFSKTVWPAPRQAARCANRGTTVYLQDRVSIGLKSVNLKQVPQPGFGGALQLVSIPVPQFPLHEAGVTSRKSPLPIWSPER